MPVEFGSIAFYEEMADLMNNDPEWERVGRKLNYAMVYDYGAPLNRSFFVTFDGGKMSYAVEADNQLRSSADFVITGPPEVWDAIFQKQLAPMRAITRGQMKVRGKVAELLKNMDAFNYMLDAMTKIEYQWERT